MLSECIFSLGTGMLSWDGRKMRRIKLSHLTRWGVEDWSSSPPTDWRLPQPSTGRRALNMQSKLQENVLPIHFLEQLSQSPYLNPNNNLWYRCYTSNLTVPKLFLNKWTKVSLVICAQLIEKHQIFLTSVHLIHCFCKNVKNCPIIYYFVFWYYVKWQKIQ